MLPDTFYKLFNFNVMENKFYLGIDVSKGYADFTILNHDKKIVENNFQLDDTFEGHNQLFKILTGFFAGNPEAHLHAAVESTGGYENNWYYCLNKFQAQFNISVARLNPFGVNYNSKASLERNVTDKLSAKNIAIYLINHSEKVNYQKEDYFCAERRQWTFSKLLTKQKVQLLNQLESFLYISNPEVLTYCKDGMSTWTLKLLKQYPTARDLANARATTVAKIPYISKVRSEELVRNAKSSVASAVDEVTAEVIRSLVTQIISLRKLIDLQTKQIEKTCDISEIKLLKTFTGIGAYSAVGLMIEIISATRFSNVKKLVSFFGIHPIYKKSGDGISGYKMSKKGRKEPRQILFNVARISIIHNPLIKEIYASHLKKGMSKMSALGAIMHKILRVIYGMLKNNTSFDPNIDRENSKKILTEKINGYKNKDRRFLELTENAPISRRQTKKRKEQNSSQDDKTSNTGSSSDSFQIVLEQT